LKTGFSRSSYVGCDLVREVGLRPKDQESEGSGGRERKPGRERYTQTFCGIAVHEQRAKRDV